MYFQMTYRAMLSYFFLSRYHFVCQKWLSDSKDDGMISREILESNNDAYGLAHARGNQFGSSTDFGLERKGTSCSCLLNSTISID
jgi:hypothetical protein